jgi:hypothetical protein
MQELQRSGPITTPFGYIFHCSGHCSAPSQLTSGTEVVAAAAAGEITVTDTEESYRCSVVGPK